MAIDDEKYVSFTTFKRDGTAVASPVWIVPVDGGRYGFWTASTSGKAKRLRRDPKVLLQPSDSRGRVKAGSSTVEGTAVILAAGPEADVVRARVKAKYGFMVVVTKTLFTLNKLIHRSQDTYGDSIVVITPADHTG